MLNNQKTGGGEFRRSNCLRQAYPPSSRSMNPAGIHHTAGNTRKKPPYIDYTSLSRILKRANFKSMKKDFSIQQCASILLPVIFSIVLIVLCVITALALLTDGFSLCSCRGHKDVQDLEGNSSALCLTNECIRKAHYLLDRIDQHAIPCENFYKFTCGRSARSINDQASTFVDELRAKLEQKPRPSFPLPYRLLFDYYDSCVSDDYQEQLGIQPFNALISRLGGWPLLQNAKFDADTFEWEALEQQMHAYEISGLFHTQLNPNANTVIIKSPDLLLKTYRRQTLDDYFSRLLEELEVDEELAQESVQQALDFESSLIDIFAPKPFATIKLTLSDLKERYPTIQWNKFTLSMGETKGDQTEMTIEPEYVDRLQAQLEGNGTKKAIGNYMMLKVLHFVVPFMQLRYRNIRERLDERYEPRWRTCLNEMSSLMPVPLYSFSFQHLDTLNHSRVGSQVAKSKEQVAKRIRSLAWMDPESKDKMLQNLHNLRVLTNLLNGGSQTEEQIRALYAGGRLDPTSYFDNVLMLKQTNSRLIHKTLLGNYDWIMLMLNERPIIDAENKELVYGPISVRALMQVPELVQALQIRKHIFEFLFHPDTIAQLKPESRSIIQSKFHCFEKHLPNPAQLIYDQMSLQAAADEKFQDDVRLPGLSDYNGAQLLYITFGASACNSVGAEKSINHIIKNLDGFAEAFACPLGMPMNPRDKCSIL